MDISMFTQPINRSLNRVQHGARVVGVVLALLLLTVSLAMPAAARQVTAVVLAGGDGADSGHSLAVDTAGNRYLTGSFQTRATFGADTNTVVLTSRGGDDGFVAKYDATGALVWARQVGGASADAARGIAVAADGSVYVAGFFSSSAVFVGSPIRLTAQGQTDLFVAKYTGDGQLVWAFRGGGTTTDNGLDLAVDGGGNALLTGVFSGAATFADADAPAAATLTSAGSTDIVIAKYDEQGQLVWARRAGGSGNDAGRGITVDGAGNVYVTGGFSAQAAFVSPAKTVTLTSAGVDDVFVARYGPGGNLQWAQRAGGAKADRGLAIALDASGTSYVTGFFTEEATFGAITRRGTDKDLFLVKLGPNGGVLQAASAGGAGPDEGRGIALGAQGTIHLTGTYRDTALFGEGGRVRELRQITRTDTPNTAIFIATYDTALRPTFVEGAGGEANDREQSGNDIAIDANGRIHLTGIVQDRITFGIGSNRVGLGDSFPGDAFIATYTTGTPNEVFYLSSDSDGTVDGLAFADEDVLAFDPANDRWSVLIDGSDIGLGATDIDGFEWRADNTVLMSVDTPVTLPGIAFEVDDSDIVRFIPSSLGTTTTGRYEFVFDGSDVGLTGDAEDIDAIGVARDGRIMVSTLGAASVPGASSEIFVDDEDLLTFVDTRLGDATRGTWALFYNASVDRLGDNDAENMNAVWFPPDSDNFVFGTGSAVDMAFVTFGDGADLFICNIFTTTDGNRCGPSIFLDSASKGLRGEVVDAFAVGKSGVLGDERSTVFIPLVGK